MKQFVKALGKKGTILFDGDKIYFRVYNNDSSFTDYELVHNDLDVQIIDEDAEFDTVNKRLDHSSATLGRE